MNGLTLTLLLVLAVSFVLYLVFQAHRLRYIICDEEMVWDSDLRTIELFRYAQGITEEERASTGLAQEDLWRNTASQKKIYLP